MLTYLKRELDNIKRTAEIAGGDWWRVVEDPYETRLLNSTGKEIVRIPYRGDQASLAMAELFQRNCPERAVKRVASDRLILGQCEAILFPDSSSNMNDDPAMSEEISFALRILHMTALAYRDGDEEIRPLRRVDSCPLCMELE